MKKSTVVMLCVGFVLLVLGGGIFALTWSMGAVGYQGNFFHFGFDSGDEPYYYDNNHYDEQDTFTYGGKVYENKSLKLDGANAQFTQMELRLGVADTVVTQDGGPGYVKAENFPEGKLSIEVTDGKLTVRDLTRNMNFNFGIPHSKRIRKLTVNLPPQVVLIDMKLDRGVGDIRVETVFADTITVTDGVGDLNMEGVSANRLSLSSGVGDSTLSNLVCRGDVDISRGVGEVDLTGADITGNLTVTGGTGDFDLKGTVKGNISLEVGVGDCDLELSGTLDDYYFTLDKGVGDMSIGGVDLSSKQKTYGNENAPYTIDLQGGVGEIDVDFIS